MQGASRSSIGAARERLDALAQSTGTDMESLAGDLHSVVLLLDRTVVLRRVLTDPARSGESRAAFLAQLLDGQISGESADLLGGLVRARWSQPRDLVDAIDELSIDAELIAAERDGSLDDVEDELFRFGRIVAGQRELRSTLTDPSVTDSRKAELVAGLLEGRVRPVTRRLVTRLVAHPRSRSLEAGLDAYARLAAERRRRMVALVTVALPLTEEQNTRLAAALGRLYGRPVHLNVEIDDEVLGGVRVQIGDDVIDGTVATRLDEAGRRLVR
ncbi:F0F1 ATP synthase subunit delta [Yinghuangia seranimata]|uniref:F0F1 ATP synthase subunit delta n=1 Tax=Yinghuangia seranimata TaxID=408067 RepID=UPI00248D2A00|nr:F0F1 ATP synthase subunit delta [Yinghuangia seranimata]MDI2128166.1 F0F1 ATP synthase subunit delta [Yinghuangia seranimata]